MRKIQICGYQLFVKDYHCIDCGDCFQPNNDGQYLLKDKPRLWLYVNITNQCNAGCPFCVAGAGRHNKDLVDPSNFERILKMIKNEIYGISFTGGEPMLYPELLDELIGCVEREIDDHVEVDIATNGTDIHKISEMTRENRVSSIHISRHSISDDENRKMMRNNNVPSMDDIKKIINSAYDPAKYVLNCVLQKDGVDSPEKVAEYMNTAVSMGVRNVSFISMFMANDYCRDHFISANDFPFITDKECDKWNILHPESKFFIWNRYRDYDYCKCLTGSYHNSMGSTRFYFRCPGTKTSPEYCRQLVYTADNQLRDGFGDNSRILI